MKKKEMKIYPKGEKLFNKIFKNSTALPKAKSIAELKAKLKANENCKKLNEKQLQMLAIYIWDVKLKDQHIGIHKNKTMHVPRKAKCPVCGMFVYKYPRWAAVLKIKINGKEKNLYFDGVKDLMKFYFSPEKWGEYKDITISKIDVTDYYQQKIINGKKAFYVIGSDVLGPMGNELIPFEKESDAEVFSRDHLGKKILSFDEITEKTVYGLDE